MKRPDVIAMLAAKEMLNGGKQRVNVEIMSLINSKDLNLMELSRVRSIYRITTIDPARVTISSGGMFFFM